MCGAWLLKDAGGVEEDGKGGRRIGGCGNHFRRIDLGGDFRTDPGRLRTCPLRGAGGGGLTESGGLIIRRNGVYLWL